VNGRILILGIIPLAIGIAGLIGNAESGFMNTAVNQIDNNGCQNVCNVLPSAPQTSTIPSFLIYPLLAIGAVVVMVGLTKKGPAMDAT
jgi:hypothetical protein